MLRYDACPRAEASALRSGLPAPVSECRRRRPIPGSLGSLDAAVCEYIRCSTRSHSDVSSVVPILAKADEPSSDLTTHRSAGMYPRSICSHETGRRPIRLASLSVRGCSLMPIGCLRRFILDRVTLRFYYRSARFEKARTRKCGAHNMKVAMPGNAALITRAETSM